MTHTLIRRLLALASLLYIVTPQYTGAVSASQPTTEVSVVPAIEVDRAISEVKDTTLRVDYRIAAYGRLLHFPVSERKSALRKLIVETNDDFSAMAALQLIADGDPQGVRLVSSRFATWSNHNDLIILQTVADKILLHSVTSPVLIAIPRQVLFNWCYRLAPVERSSDMGHVVDIAAYTLALGGDHHSHELIRKALDTQPTTGLWIASSPLDTAGTFERKLAKSLLRGTTGRLIDRMAAAIFLAPHDDEAQRFAEENIGHVISKYELLEHSSKRYVETEQKDRLSFVADMHIMGMLIYLNSSRVMTLLSRMSNVADQSVHILADLVSVIKEPVRFLNSSHVLDNLGSEPYFLSFLVIRNPRLVTAALQKLRGKLSLLHPGWSKRKAGDSAAQILNHAISETRLLGFHVTFNEAGSVVEGLL